ncbi:unnamed protein product [Calypogeia fissa]
MGGRAESYLRLSKRARTRDERGGGTTRGLGRALLALGGFGVGLGRGGGGEGLGGGEAGASGAWRTVEGDVCTTRPGSRGGRLWRGGGEVGLVGGTCEGFGPLSRSPTVGEWEGSRKWRKLSKKRLKNRNFKPAYFYSDKFKTRILMLVLVSVCESA